jgi:hypothetical protein
MNTRSLVRCSEAVWCNNAWMNKQAFSGLDRRGFLGVCSMVGLGQTLLPGALFVLATQAKAQRSALLGGVSADATALPSITPEMIDAAAVIVGISVTAEQKQLMMEGLDAQRKSYGAIRELKMANSVSPAFVFDPVPGGMVLDTVKRPFKISAAPDVKALGRSGFGRSGRGVRYACLCFGAGARGAG